MRAEITRGALALPERVVASLGVADGDSIAMVRRKNAVALKRAEPETVEAARRRREKVPQVAAIVRYSTNGTVPLKANVRKGLGTGPLFLHTDGGDGAHPRGTQARQQGTVPQRTLAVSAP